MIFFLYGKDTFRSRQKLVGIIEGYKKVHKSGLNLKFFEKGEFSFEDIKSGSQTISMFEEKKLLVFKNIFSDLNKEEGLEEFLKKQQDDLIIVYQEGEPDKRLSLFKFLIKTAKAQEFEFLEGVKLRNWARERIESQGAKIDSPALEKLLDYVGNDLWWLSGEIDKLASYKKQGKIEEADIELLVKPKIEPEIFKTIDAIALRNNSWSGKKQALKMLHQHLESGDHPLYLLSMINYQFRNLLMVKGLMEKNQPYYNILKTVKMHPFVAQKSYEQARHFTLQELKKIYQKIFQIDLMVKTGKVDSLAALDALIVSI
jgi:DNA polymerase-3 subunit delta